MINKISKSFIYLLIAVTILASAAVSGASVNADSGNVNITLNPHDNLGSVSGVEFSVYKVGDVQADTDKPVFDDIYNIKTPPVTAEEMLADIKILKDASKPQALIKVKTSEDGTLDLTLERGIYYIEAGANNYGVIEPMLIWLPYFDEITQDMSYSISLEPKAEPNGTVQGEEEFPPDEKTTDGSVLGQTSNPDSNGKVLGDEAKTSDDMNMISVIVVIAAFIVLGIALALRDRSTKQ